MWTPDICIHHFPCDDAGAAALRGRQGIEMSKHTPGPWLWHWAKDDKGHADGRIHTDPKDDWQIGAARCIAVSPRYESEEQWGANARLIAAAPDLLDALKWMVENDETNEGDHPLPEHGGQTWDQINAYWIDGLNKARAAIAKATGE